MKELTKAEEQIMHIIWEQKKCYIKDIVDRMPEPKPAYTTVSTIVRILEKKGFIGYTAYGKTHEYYPLVDKKSYTRQMFKGILSGYFGDSIRQMVSFFSKDKDLSVSELEELKSIIEEEISRKSK
jgi:BlaI family transcriptional regulator, penicillinase repressor